MNPPETIQVQIAGVTLRVPVHESPEASRKLADLVSRQVKEIEAQSTRIDTQAFALQAAYAFAAELGQARIDHHQGERDMMAALSQLHTTILEILGELDKGA